jgi:site-specific DNA-methyltransferase (adenine-specific)
MPQINLHHIDCMEFMRGLPDKTYDLAIVDPPYGIMDRMYNGGDRNASTVFFKEHLKTKRWDERPPTDEYFSELERVSVNQIIWGGNYFALAPTRGIICWDKMVYVPTMSQIEMAWTSFDCVARYIKIASADRFRTHPTQKPVTLYRWLLQNYAKPGQRILDTHLGSGSIAIACDIEGFDLDGCEIDADYIAGARKRLADHRAQPRLFATEAPPHPTQMSLLP